jgi:hypothetical protein
LRPLRSKGPTPDSHRKSSLDFTPPRGLERMLGQVRIWSPTVHDRPGMSRLQSPPAYQEVSLQAPSRMACCEPWPLPSRAALENLNRRALGQERKASFRTICVSALVPKLGSACCFGDSTVPRGLVPDIRPGGCAMSLQVSCPRSARSSIHRLQSGMYPCSRSTDVPCQSVNSRHAGSGLASKSSKVVEAVQVEGGEWCFFALHRLASTLRVSGIHLHPAASPDTMESFHVSDIKV